MELQIQAHKPPSVYKYNFPMPKGTTKKRAIEFADHEIGNMKDASGGWTILLDGKEICHRMSRGGR